MFYSLRIARTSPSLMKWEKKRRRRQRRRIAIHQNKIFPSGFQACPKQEEITTPGLFDTKGNEDAWVSDGVTPTKARMLADHLFRLDPIAKLLPILFSYINFIINFNMTGGGGEVASMLGGLSHLSWNMWHPVCKALPPVGPWPA